MSITLYKAVDDLRELLDQIDPETGELPPGYETAREVVERKTTSVIAYIKRAGIEADAYEAHAKELQRQIKAERARINHLSTYLLQQMARSGITEIADGLQTVKRYPERDKSVEVFDVEQVPQEFMRVVPATQEPDKTAISKAIAAGVDVAGARVVFKDRLTIK